MESLLSEIRQCTHCSKFLELGPRPVVNASATSRLLIIGQAPGIKVHQSGVAWADASGNNLRKWLGIDKASFYDVNKVAIMPMGFCYPGKGKSGDLAPRKECAPLWHHRMLEKMTSVKLTLLIGNYAQNQYLKERKKESLRETVRSYANYLPDYFPLPHPSPRNNIWMKKNPWFSEDLIPVLQQIIKEIL